ncbi:oxidoreductase [Chitinibacter bivalviorum]|uniref:Oxidoreductase n=1 Tax=Chitinibacter bivalviorum TaxID=2739434 RepID=A0A7H9BKY1_9NEIS|nr:oxidoreductase [Chitinibacter bivalviorum]QLG88918.1 oxidoreductase [Chitinibacter bivalviorum]
MDQLLRVGLIAYGYAAKTLHAPLIDATQGLQLTAIASSRPADVIADWPDIVVKTEPDRLITHPGLDLVVIATPNDTHYPLARAALAAGKHVVIDKPFTLDLREADDLVQRAEEAGKLLSVFHNRRWDSDFLHLSQTIAAGTLGRVVEFTSRFDRFRPDVRQRWREDDVVGAGLWYDLGPHLIDQALQLFGMPEAVSADLVLRRDGAKAVDDFNVILHYKTMRAVLAASTLVHGGTPRFLAQGTQAAYSVSGLDLQEGWLKAGLRPDRAQWGVDQREATVYHSFNDAISSESLPLGQGDYAGYYAKIRDAILGLGPNPVPASEACNVMRILDLARQSAAEGRKIAVI